MRKLVLLLVIGIFSCSAMAATEITLISIEDSMVDNIDVTGSGISGEEQLMTVQGFMAGPSSLESVQRSYLKFDLSDIPDEAEIISAVLRIYLESSNGGGFNTADPHTSVHYVGDDSWSEGAINWGNKPDYDAGYMDAELLVVGFGYKEWNLLSDSGSAKWDYAADLGEEDNIISLMIKTPNEDFNTFANFQTSEGNMKPELVISYDVIPEPATLCLLGIGGLFVRRRRS